MPLQYLQDHTGQTTAVLIPIDEWRAIMQEHADLAILDSAIVAKNRKASDFKGILSPQLTEDLQQHVQQSREQWD